METSKRLNDGVEFTLAALWTGAVVAVEEKAAARLRGQIDPLPTRMPPAELRELRGWLIWRIEYEDGAGKPRKVPYYASGQKRRGKQGSPTDRAQLVTYDEAKAAADRPGFAGVGLAMLPDWGITALDFDYCVGPGGNLPPEIEAIVTTTYAEYSPSGKGIRAFVKGRLGNPKSLKNHPDGWGVEFFESSGFVTVTGSLLLSTEVLGLENTIAEASPAVYALAARRFGEKRAAANTDELDPFAGIASRLDLSIDECRELLSRLDPSMDREPWIKVGMALHHEHDGSEEAFTMWDDWSSGGQQYPSEDSLRAQWDSFTRRAQTTLKPITMATVKWMAADGSVVDANAEPTDLESSVPVDLWRRHEPPSLPAGLLPPVIEAFARVQGDMMGVDPGGLAMAALTVCAAAIPDQIRLQVKEHDTGWTESARIWTALVGPPSAKKSPIIGQAAKPLRKLDAQLRREHDQARAAWSDLPPDERRGTPEPTLVQLILEDTTIEAAQGVLANNPDGVLCLQDELSGWFGSMDKYSGPKGAAKDRGFWLQAFNGGTYSINRVQRGASYVENLSVSLLGGIQPEPIRKTVNDAVDDGLIQRLFPIVLGAAEVGKDEPSPDVVSEYGVLVGLLRDLANPMFDAETLRFEPGAQAVQRRMVARHHELTVLEVVNRKLASHIGKYDGLYARLCVLWHCTENAKRPTLPAVVTQNTADRVASFLHDFLLPHAVAFYDSVLGLAEDHDRLLDVAGYILAHNKTEITGRDLQRGSRGMKALNRDEARKIFERLEAFGWLEAIAPKTTSAAPRWRVHPAVHTLFAERSREESARRAEMRKVIARLADGGPV